MSPGSIAQGNFYAKVRLHIFEFATAIVFFLLGLNYLMDDQAGKRSPIGATLHPFDYAWYGSYVVATPLIICGVLAGSQRVRVAGLTLLGTAQVMNFIAAITSDPLEARDFVYLIFSIACFLRAFLAAETVNPTRLGRRVARG